MHHRQGYPAPTIASLQQHGRDGEEIKVHIKIGDMVNKDVAEYEDLQLHRNYASLVEAGMEHH